MKTVKNSIALIILILFITSCSTSSNVVSNKFLQKRKYNKGFHFSRKHKITLKSEESKALIDSMITLNKEIVIEENISFKLSKKTNSFLSHNTNKETVEKPKKVNVKSKTDKKQGLVIKASEKKEMFLKKVKPFILKKNSLKSNVSRANNSNFLDDASYWNWTAIMMVVGILLLITLLIFGLGWAGFLVFMLEVFKVLLLIFLYVIIILGVIVFYLLISLITAGTFESDGDELDWLFDIKL